MGYVKDILDFVAHPWLDLLLALAVFGLAPDLVLRLLVLAYPKASDRRKELIAELRVVPRWERPFWVTEQVTFVISEGLHDRLDARKARKISPWIDVILVEDSAGSPSGNVYVYEDGRIFKLAMKGRTWCRGPEVPINRIEGLAVTRRRMPRQHHWRDR